MIARTALALVAFAILQARAQPTSLWVDVSETTEDPDFQESEEQEKRYTPELVEELEAAKGDALLLYTEFTARAGQSYKQFLRNISSLETETRLKLAPGVLDMAPTSCRTKFEHRMKKILLNAHRGGAFSGENHHKFFLGHMIVFRMHLNKSEEYIKKSEKVISACGILCEKQPKIKRWRRIALDELNRVRDDMQHSRLMYRDLLTHAQRRLNTVRRKAYAEAKAAREDLTECAAGGLT